MCVVGGSQITEPLIDDDCGRGSSSRFRECGDVRRRLCQNLLTVDESH